MSETINVECKREESFMTFFMGFDTSELSALGFFC